MKLLSIVTISYNTANDLRETLASIPDTVRASDYVEHIIIDGGSTDGSIELITEYAPDSFVAEKDRGIYDAMNKGVRLASGKFIAFLNSGDIIISAKAFDDCLSSLQKGDADIISFGKTFYNYRKVLTKKIPTSKDLKNAHIFMPLIHQGLCIKKEAYEATGLYDINYKIVADCDWLLRYLAKYGHNKIQFTNICLVQMGRGGVSDVATSLGARTLEHAKIRSAAGFSPASNLLITLRYFITRRLKYFLKRFF